MKNGRFAVAAACAALACAAGAQTQTQTGSSVTLYGTLDAFAGQLKGATTGVNARDTKTSVLNSGGMSTSHWGVRGVEDLGGGLAAAFELSSFIRNDTGAAGRSEAIPAPINVAADPYFSRQSWVGLRSTQWGGVRLGNTTTPMFVASTRSNAFGDSTVFSPLNVILFVGGPLSGGTAWTDQVVYDAPRIGGFTGTIGYSDSESHGGPNLGARINYDQGPFSAVLAGQSVKKNPTTFADGTSQNNTKAWLAGASWDFGAAKVFGHVGHVQNNGTEAAPLDVGYRVWEVSVAVPFGSGAFTAGYAQRRTGDAVGAVAATAAGGNVKRQIASIGYDYVLSKRTDVYAVVMNDRTQTRTLPAPGSVVEASGTNWGIGIRHRF